MEDPASVVESRRLQGQHRGAVDHVGDAEVADENAVDVLPQTTGEDSQDGQDIPHHPEDGQDNGDARSSFKNDVWKAGDAFAGCGVRCLVSAGVIRGDVLVVWREGLR